MLQGDRLDPVKGAAVEFHHRDRAGPRVGVHTGRRIVPAWSERFGVAHLDFDGIASELGMGADEFERTCLAYCTAATIATDKPASGKSLATRVNTHLVV